MPGQFSEEEKFFEEMVQDQLNQLNIYMEKNVHHLTSHTKLTQIGS